jgi:hypothetical protein
MQDMGLRDVARFDGWVVPPENPPPNSAAEPQAERIPPNMLTKDFAAKFPDTPLVDQRTLPRSMDPRLDETLDPAEEVLEPVAREDVDSQSPDKLCRYETLLCEW